MAKPKFFSATQAEPNGCNFTERGESNGNRRNVLLVLGARRGAVTETIKVIAIKISEFPIATTNRLKSAIGF